MRRPAWVGPEIDLQKPSPARVYDVHLGGSHNFQVDRDAAAAITNAMPGLPAILRANRAYLRRAVSHLAGQGITQFLDLGSGIPTVGNVHEVAWRTDPSARVVYVDCDAVAVAHSRAILRDEPNADAVLADLRRPEDVLEAAETRRLIDFSQPVAVLMFAVLHFVDDADDPAGLVRRYLEPAAPGSHLALSHASFEGDADRAEEGTRQFRRRVGDFTMRDRREVTALFGDLEIVEPGVVYLPQWRPDPGDDVSDASTTSTFAGVGRKA
ncbi:SAM-dependent methyltransferase [Saccharothrix sp. NPDC042600]|uniref:SAM-dependent methyltransferase n=1 Tax=Saccharothrix TaxID=2071 RepID=UPI00340AB177|nr:SAM-dependent methyltransferase [Saccharothrix mutabilis subsp. capreolus]